MAPSSGEAAGAVPAVGRALHTPGAGPSARATQRTRRGLQAVRPPSLPPPRAQGQDREEQSLAPGNAPYVCYHCCARTESTFSKRRNWKGSNTNSADEDGDIYDFTGALNFPTCPSPGPVDGFPVCGRTKRSAGLLPVGALQSWVKHYFQAFIYSPSCPLPQS